MVSVIWGYRTIHFFNCKRYSSLFGKNLIEAFLSHLAVERDVAVALQGKAQAAIL